MTSSTESFPAAPLRWSYICLAGSMALVGSYVGLSKLRWHHPGDAARNTHSRLTTKVATASPTSTTPSARSYRRPPARSSAA